MNKLTAEKCRELLAERYRQRDSGDISIGGIYTLQALEIALPVLEQQVVVPDGWRMVPVEPTEEMISAGDQFMDGLSRLGDAYEAMLAAAPQPSTTPQVDNDGWIEWKGGKSPVKKGEIVEIMLRDGCVYQGDEGDAHILIWQDRGLQSDIIAYRVIEADGREG